MPKWWATPRAMPRPAPVTMATLPSNRFCIILLICSLSYAPHMLVELRTTADLAALWQDEPGPEGALEDGEEVVVVPLLAAAVDDLGLFRLHPAADVEAAGGEDVAGDVAPLIGGEVDEGGG